MKPISITIEDYAHFSREQVVETFQKFVFSKGITWFMSKDHSIKCLNERIFNIEKGDDRFRLEVRRIEGRTPAEKFTIPSQWLEFQLYLDKYIAYHSKPEPKVGEYWYVEPPVSMIPKGIVKIENVSHPLIDCTYSNGENLSCKPSQLISLATTSDIEQYNQQAREAEKEELIKEAKRRYKVGDKVIGLDSRTIYELAEFRTDRNDVKHKMFWFSYGQLWAKAHGFNTIVYRNGEWAEVVEPKEEPENTDKERIKELEEALERLKEETKQKINEALHMGMDAGQRAENLYRGINWED